MNKTKHKTHAHSWNDSNKSKSESSAQMQFLERINITRLIALTCTCNHLKTVSVFDQEIPHSQTAGDPVASRGRATQQSRDTRKINKAKQPAISLINMIAKLEWTQSNAQQIIEQLQNPTMGVKINKELTTTEPPP